MRGKKVIVLSLTAAVVLLLVFLAGCQGWLAPKKRANGNDVVPVRTVEVGSNNSYISVSGKVEGIETANVVSKVAGKVTLIYVDIGSEVRAGQVLFELDAAELLAAVAQAEASVRVMESTKQQAQLDLEVAKANYERGKVLLQQGAISQSDFDNKFELPYRKAEEYALRGMDAQLAQARAALELARANYANSIVTSPINGVVVAKNVNAGEMVSPSVTAVTVVNIDKVFVEAGVSEELINSLEVGQQVEVVVPAAASGSFVGTVTNIAAGENASTKAYPVKIQIDNSGRILKAGMFAEARIPLRAAGEGLVVPREAVVREGSDVFVWVVKDGRASKKVIAISRSGSDYCLVTDGLEAGDEVIISGIEQLSEGCPVSVEK